MRQEREYKPIPKVIFIPKKKSYYRLGADKRWLVKRRRCPQCESLNGRFTKSDADGHPVWYCDDCNVWSSCRYI